MISWSQSQESDHPTGGWLVPFQFHRRFDPRRTRVNGVHGVPWVPWVPWVHGDGRLAGAGEGADDGAGHGDVADRTDGMGLGKVSRKNQRSSGKNNIAAIAMENLDRKYI